MNKRLHVLSYFFPEVRISGYTSIDGTVEFYGRINSLVDQSMVLLDYGAGRGAWYDDDCAYRKALRNMRGKVTRIVGCDIDEAIFRNEAVDERVQVSLDEPLPFENETFDLIISDYTFEHVTSPERVASELHRVLKKGGWICARTPNKYAYTSILTRLIKNSYHSKLLAHVQPERSEVDIFPTAFRLNSMRDIARYFGSDRFEHYTYRHEPEPAYHFNSKLVLVIMLIVNKWLPQAVKSTLLVFLRKRSEREVRRDATA